VRAARRDRASSAANVARLEAWAALIVLPVSLAGCHRTGTAQGRAEASVPVRVARTLQATVPVQLNAVGRIEPIAQVAVKARVGGELTRVWFTEGQNVRAGETLFTIDPRPYQAALEAAEAQLARDRALQSKAELDARRYANLLEQQLATQEQYDQMAANLEALRAAIAGDQATVSNARLQLAYCTITSPIAGRTGALTLKRGNQVKADDDSPLVTVSQIRPIAASFSVPARWLGEIVRRRSHPIRVVVAPSESGAAAEGTLSFVDNAVDAATSTVLLKATFPNLNEALWPGQFVQVTATLGEEPDRVVAPAPAVQTGQSGPYVFVVKADQTVELRPVTVARMDERDAVIATGLAAGEMVVTEGQLRLLPGSRVDVRQ
jgi:multidrug efflux system membrane fusion protein